MVQGLSFASLLTQRNLTKMEYLLYQKIFKINKNCHLGAEHILFDGFP